MADASTTSGSRPRGVLDRLLWFTGLALVVTLLLALDRPAGTIFPARRVELPMQQAQHDAGACWILAHPLGVPSDADERGSAVALFEDGRPLQAHALHDDIRAAGGGRFSHWGDHLYIASSDGSDPTTNGRTYTAEIPTAVPAWFAPAILTALAGGAVLALAGFVLSRRRRRPLSTDGLVLALGAVLVLAWGPDPSRLRPLLTLEDARAELVRTRRAATAHAATRPGNVRLLLPGDGEPSFTASAEPLPAEPPRRFALTPEPGVEQVDGLARLVPGGPGLVAPFEPLLRLDEIGEILLPLRLVQGTLLEVSLRDPNQPDKVPVSLEIPVVPAAERQALRVRDPITMFTWTSEMKLDALRVAAPAGAPRDVVLDLSEAVIEAPSAAFQRATHGTRSLETGRDLRPAAWQSVAGRFRVPLDGARGELLKGAVGVFGGGDRARATWRVLAEAADGSRRVLAEGRTTGADRWHEQRIDWPRAPSETRGGTLLLEVTELSAGAACAWAGWRLVDTSRPPQRVLLLVLDTLRRDALGAFGGREAATPFLDGLARAGTRFTRAYSQAYWTRPSMPSMMTARYVAATGIEMIGQQLPPAFPTLPEAFERGGFLTVADISNTNAGPAAGLDQGWQRLRHLPTPGSIPAAEQLGGELPTYLRTTAEEDLLLYVHLMDAHGPYGPPEPPAGAIPTFSGEPLEHDPALDRPWTQRVTAQGRRHWYHRDVETLDADLARFFDELASIWGEGALDTLSVALTSDHGEYLGEHGEWGHGWAPMMPEVLNVPMFVVAPGLPADAVVDTPVENVDLAPTLLELADLSAAALGDADGRSLLPLLRGERAAVRRTVLAEVGIGGSRLMTIADERRLLLGTTGSYDGSHLLDAAGRSAGPLSAPDGSLFERELAEHLADDFAALWAEYLASRGAVRERFWAEVDTSETTVDPLALKQLEELGYLGG